MNVPQTNTYHNRLVEDAERRIEELVESYMTAETVVNTLLSYKNSLRSINFQKNLNNGIRNKPANLLQILQAPSTKETFERAKQMLSTVIQDGNDVILILDVANKDERIYSLINIIKDLQAKATNDLQTIEVLQQNFKNLASKTETTQQELAEAEERRIEANLENVMKKQSKRRQLRLLKQLIANKNLKGIKGFTQEQVKDLTEQLNSNTLKEAQNKLETQVAYYQLTHPETKRRQPYKVPLPKVSQAPPLSAFEQAMKYWAGKGKGGRRTRKNRKN